MKKISGLIIILLLLFNYVFVSAQTESATPIMVDIGDFMRIPPSQLNIGDPNESILLAGCTWSRFDYSAAMYCIDREGNLIWSFDTIDEDGSYSADLFTSFVQHDGKCIALRVETGSEEKYYLTTINQGVIESETELRCRVDNIYNAKDGIILLRKIFTDNIRTSCQIALYDFHGVNQWMREYNEKWHFRGWLTVEDGYIAYGYDIADPNGNPVGLVVKFDDDGELEWATKIDSVFTVENASYANGDLALLAVYIQKGEAMQDGCALLWVDDLGHVSFRKDITYVDPAFGNEPLNASGASICHAGDDFLVSFIQMFRPNALRFQVLDRGGIPLREWITEDTNLNSSQGVDWIISSQGLYWVANGFDYDAHYTTMLGEVVF